MIHNSINTVWFQNLSKIIIVIFFKNVPKPACHNNVVKGKTTAIHLLLRINDNYFVVNAKHVTNSDDV